ncbi:MAG: hypothetical protein U0Q12_23535 [Vicinamibacterales bacterium]
MTRTADTLAAALHEYGLGLKAELGLLRQLVALAAAERTASHEARLADVECLVAERDALLAGLLDLEAGLRPTRSMLADHLEVVRGLPAFPAVSALHREAAALVSSVLTTDADTLASLRRSEHARRERAQSLDAADSTLAAYRRVVSPALQPAALVDERG